MAEPDPDQLRTAARRLLQQPLLCAEQQPDTFVLIRRHEQALDRWFTQRLGYRLHVSSTTARLFKNTVVPHRRPLLVASSSRRPLSQREYILLVLVLAAVAAGPRVISLRDLINDVRTAAADADVTIGSESIDRRALVTALKWLMKAGLAFELHENVGRYEFDADADAIIEVDPDRIGLLPLSVLARAESAEELVDRSDQRATVRQWLRARLVEDPVLYREDLDEHEWSELRRRTGEEVLMLDEMFGLELESRAEGVAAIDPAGQLSDQTFPATGTISHAALLFIDKLVANGGSATYDEASEAIRALAEIHQRHWSKNKIDNLTSLLQHTLEQLGDMRLVVFGPAADASIDVDRIDQGSNRSSSIYVRALPAAARFAVVHQDANKSDDHGLVRKNDIAQQCQENDRNSDESKNTQSTLW